MHFAHENVEAFDAFTQVVHRANPKLESWCMQSMHSLFLATLESIASTFKATKALCAAVARNQVYSSDLVFRRNILRGAFFMYYLPIV